MKGVREWWRRHFPPAPRCKKCGSKHLEKGYWSRGWNDCCNQAAGSRGTRCYDCGLIIWDKPYEEAIKEMPEFIRFYQDSEYQNR